MRAVLILPLLLCVSSPALARDLVVIRHGDPVPEAVASPIGALLAPAGVRVTAGDASLDFWWVAQLETGAGAGPQGAVAWAAVPEGTLLGAVRVSAPYRDVRGRVIKPGVYTLRYGIQPADGDHLGLSPYRDFLLLVPAAIDGDPAPLGHDRVVELSTRTVGGSHPAVWSVNPPATDAEPLTVLRHDAGHEAVVFELGSGGASTLRFGLILVGRIEV
jgi:hypothetical protein